jgi:2-polyprenyl-3-methyl-5-hydroxy-6-metoxy-1,4-benzoquinol methylase
MKMSNGLSEDGVIVGNAYDKYGSSNPVVQHIMRGFDNALTSLVRRAAPTSIYEIGCGEGYWVLRWNSEGIATSGSDFSATVVDIARENAVAQRISPDVFTRKNIYEVTPDDIEADLVVCCEVLEHLDEPERALRILASLRARHVILSVPREPIWSAMNLARGKYIGALGNTPGHVQRWSQRGFVRLVEKYFDIVEMRMPIPWTMVLCTPRLASSSLGPLRG